jgi:hypothetical protein
MKSCWRGSAHPKSNRSSKSPKVHWQFCTHTRTRHTAQFCPGPVPITARHVASFWCKTIQCWADNRTCCTVLFLTSTLHFRRRDQTHRHLAARFHRALCRARRLAAPVAAARVHCCAHRDRQWVWDCDCGIHSTARRLPTARGARAAAVRFAAARRAPRRRAGRPAAGRGAQHTRTRRLSVGHGRRARAGVGAARVSDAGQCSVRSKACHAAGIIAHWAAANRIESRPICALVVIGKHRDTTRSILNYFFLRLFLCFSF